MSLFRRALILSLFVLSAIFLCGASFYYVHHYLTSARLREQWTETYFTFTPCNCTKHVGVERRMLNEYESTCSQEASWYGPNQKVISFCLFRGNRSDDNFMDFINGIEPNLIQIRALYPDWLVRIYSDQSLDPDYCKVACLDRVFWCDITTSSVPDLSVTNPRVWRFVPLGDPTVDIFISRDIDSLIVEREREVVADWEQTPEKPFHLARDSGSHNAKEMLAGLWGANNYVLGWTKAQEIRAQILQGALYTSDRERDEALLKEIIFLKHRDLILQHDSYRCDFYKDAKPFPKQRVNRTTRLAQSIRNIGKYIAPECPVECRPSYGKDWAYC